MKTLKTAITETLERTTKDPEATTQKAYFEPWGIDSFAKWAKFDSLNDSELEKLLTASNEFARDLNAVAAPRWLTMLGNSGVGKTMLAKRLHYFANQCGQVIFDRAVSGQRDCGNIFNRVRFFSWPEIVKGMYRGEYGILDDIKTDWFVVLDEIGATRGGQSQKAKDQENFITQNLFEILNARLGKWTVLTGNVTIDKINAWDTRIASRLIRGGNVVVSVQTKDYALRR